MIVGEDFMFGESLGLCRWLLGATGISTILMGVTTPTPDVWPKVVAILGGLVATMFCLLFGTVIKHIGTHTTIVEDQIDKKMDIHRKLCMAELHSTVVNAIKEELGTTKKE